MNTFIKVYFIALTIFLAIDVVWLGFVAKGLYQKNIGHLMRLDINWSAALLFYALFIFGLTILIILPALKAQSLTQVALYSALFGLVTYATYDLTNLATLKNWPVSITVIDLVWGTCISTSVSVLSYLIVQKMHI